MIPIFEKESPILSIPYSMHNTCLYIYWKLQLTNCWPHNSWKCCCNSHHAPTQMGHYNHLEDMSFLCITIIFNQILYFILLLHKCLIPTPHQKYDVMLNGNLFFE